MSGTSKPKPCDLCSTRPGSKFTEDITMAFQPIFDTTTGRVYAQEALVRGADGRGAGQIFEHVTDANRYHFDQTCRTTAIRVATELGIDSPISINFMPNAVYEPKNCIQQTLRAAERYDFDIRRIIFEFTEAENVMDSSHLISIIGTYRELGFRTAIDDFGAGYSGLNLLADIVPDIIKFDRHLIIDVDRDRTRQILVRNLVKMCGDLGVVPIAEGIETSAELETLQSLGLRLIQGYHLAKPRFADFTTEPLNPIRPGTSDAA